MTEVILYYTKPVSTDCGSHGIETCRNFDQLARKPSREKLLQIQSEIEVQKQKNKVSHLLHNNYCLLCTYTGDSPCLLAKHCRLELSLRKKGTLWKVWGIETRTFLGCKKQKRKIVHPRLNLSKLFTFFCHQQQKYFFARK